MFLVLINNDYSIFINSDIVKKFFLQLVLFSYLLLCLYYKTNNYSSKFCP